MTSGDSLTKGRIRNAMRAQRGAVGPAEAQRVAALVAARVWRLPALARTTRLALYLPMPGELDCTPIATRAWRRGREVFLPVLNRDELCFAPFARDSRLMMNRFGIPEPARSRHEWRRARDMDVILAPLVAFDPAGGRLGMGGGYYDRTLAFLARRAHFRRPHFIGLAYEFQKVARVPGQVWDVGLEAVVTDAASYDFRF